MVSRKERGNIFASDLIEANVLMGQTANSSTNVGFVVSLGTVLTTVDAVMNIIKEIHTHITSIIIKTIMIIKGLRGTKLNLVNVVYEQYSKFVI